ncbi:iron-siderophore ABC transporter substrate-binding protein [Pseudonocardia phyllosphaerae]|uniref:iron-siderophore ABC transporter substrate-binding protein n=1 Tax=Pseudonocardia phyllosphaerae TaxID=3390502 RepID=UPI003979D547
MTIAHKFGSTEIPAEPKRVVTLGYTDQDPVMALGVVPVGTTEWYGEYPGALWPWAKEKLGSAPLPAVLPTADTVPVEQVAALKPDLILSLYGGLTQADYDLLSRIAPTVAQPQGVQDYGIPWDEQTRIVGKALGRSERAEQMIGDVRAKIDRTKAAHPQWAGKKVITAGWFKEQWYVYSSKDPRGELLTELGMTVPAEFDRLAGDKFGSYISLERADLLDVDGIVWVTFADGEEAAIKSSPGYAQGPVVKQGRALYISSEGRNNLDPMTGYITVLSLPRLLDALPPQLDAVLDGNPATTPPAVAPSS